MSNLGHYWSEEKKAARRGKGNPYWKGNKVSVHALHDWIRDNFPKKGVCEKCGRHARTDWSNKDHQYSRNRKDWQEFCRSCHILYDKKTFGLLFHTKTLKELGKWSTKYSNCQSCQTTEKSHKSNGLCRHCYFKKYGK